MKKNQNFLPRDKLGVESFS